MNDTPLQLYEKLVATNPRVVRKRATMPYTSVNGNMFSFLAKDGQGADAAGAVEHGARELLREAGFTEAQRLDGRFLQPVLVAR